VGEAKANLENLRATEDATRNNVTLEVQQSLLNLGQSAESIVVADKGLQQSRENLSLAEGRYKTGVGNIIELTDAQVSLVAAEASRVQALVGYRTALATSSAPRRIASGRTDTMSTHAQDLATFDEPEAPPAPRRHGASCARPSSPSRPSPAPPRTPSGSGQRAVRRRPTT